MIEEPVVAEEISNQRGASSGQEKTGLAARAARHPLVTGGLVLAGAGLAYAVAKMAMSDDGTEVAREVHIETSITIDRPAAELYSFWRDFANLPHFMKNLESVTETDRTHSHWVAKGIGGIRVEWDAEVFNEKENELIAWRSREDSEVANAGSVRFQRAPEGHGTYVRISLNYNPPAGKVVATLAQLLGGEPGQLIKEDLRRLKQIMEAGETATIEGQTSGRADGVEAARQIETETAASQGGKR